MANIDDAFEIDIISLEDRLLIASGDDNPTTGGGYEAPIGSLYILSTGELFQKIGAADTDWELRGAGGSGSGTFPAAVFNFDAITTAGDPGAGMFRGNNATQPSITELYFNKNNTHGGNMSVIFDSLNANSVIYVQDADNAQGGNYLSFVVTGSITDNGTWVTVPVSNTTINGSPLVDGSPCEIVFFTSSQVINDTDDVAEGSTNLYYLESRVSANTDVSSNTAHRNITDGNPHGTNLDQLDQVTITSAAERNFLQYIGGEWVNTNEFNGLSVQFVGSEPVLCLVDTSRSNKILSTAIRSYTFSEATVSNNDWFQIGPANNALTGYIVPYDCTIVGVTSHCEDANGNTKPLNLYIDGTQVATLGSHTGTESSFTNNTFDINVNANSKLRVRAGTGGTINDTVITLFVKDRF
jgi:hypothetical protein